MNMEKAKIIFETVSSEDDDILQGLLFLYTTPEGAIPLDRNFGLNQDFLSDPIPIAKNRYALEVISKTEQYEDRVEVLVDFEEEKDGSLTPIIKILKRSEEEEELWQEL